MGIKQRLHSTILRSIMEEKLCDVWPDLCGEHAEEGRVVVFDGVNFLCGLLKHPQFRTSSAGVPRLQEFHKVLRLLLQAILEACPGAQLHFVFDGIASDAQLQCKAGEHLERTKLRLAEAIEGVESFRLTGCCRRGLPFSANVLRRCLVEVLKDLGEEHRVFLAHAQGLDLDLATTLHAVKHRARLLVTSDSDFFVLFGDAILDFQSLRIDTEGNLRCKVVRLKDRLGCLGLSSMDELLLTAFLAGSDFNAQIVQVKNEANAWCEITSCAKKALSHRLSGRRSTWQEAVRAKSPMPEYAEAFLANFDTSKYVHRDPGNCTEGWLHGGEWVMGITPVHPAVDALDPVLASFRDDVPTRSDNTSPILADRLVKAYVHGHLTGGKLQFLRHCHVRESACLTDLVPGRPLAQCNRNALSRLAAFLAGPVSESWDDEDEDNDPRFLTATIESIKESALNQDLAIEAARLEQEAWNLGGPNGSRERAEMAKRDAAHVRESLLLKLQGLTISEELPLRDEAARLPAWVPAGAATAGQGEAEDRLVARAKSFWYLATGSDMTNSHAQLVTRCLDGKAVQEEENRLFMLALAHIGNGHLCAEHIRRLGASLGVSMADLSIEAPKYDHAFSALLLGGYCWWLLTHLQDTYCLCGGKGALFNRMPALDGGPTVLTCGYVHKAKDGYKVSLKHCTEEQVPTSVMDVAKAVIHEKYPMAALEYKHHSLKASHIAPEDAFNLHDRLLFSHGSVYTIKIKAFDA